MSGFKEPEPLGASHGLVESGSFRAHHGHVGSDIDVAGQLVHARCGLADTGILDIPQLCIILLTGHENVVRASGERRSKGSEVAEGET